MRNRDTLVLVTASVCLSFVVLATLLYTSGGRFALPLDDPYIYFQYARQAAGGDFFRYNAGDPTTTGATSLLYVLLLTPLAAVLRGTSLAIAAFALGALAHALTVAIAYRLAREWLGARFARPLAWLVMLTGPVAWGMLSGMETALVTVLAAWTTLELARHLAHEPERAHGSSVRFAIAASLLCLARPETGALVCAYLLFAALLARRVAPLGRIGTWVPIATAFVPFLVNLLLTGRPGSMTLASKGAPFLPGTTLVTQVVESTQFFMHNLKGLIGSGDAAVATWPSAYTTLVTFTAPLTLPLLVLGACPALAEEARARRPGVAWFGVTLLGGTLVLWAVLLPINLHWSRYVIPFLPLVSLFVVAGVARFASLFGEGEPAVRRGFLAFVLATSAPTLLFFVAMYAWNGREIADQHITMARWLAAETPAGSWVGTNDVGAIAYYSDRKVLDLHGLVTRELAEAKQVGSGAVLEHLEAMPPHRRPGTLVVIPGWYDPSFLRLHRPVRSQTLYKATIAGSPLVAYQANWTYVGAADRPGPETLSALGSRRLVDELDVAHLADERDHAYELDLLPGTSASPIGILTLPGDDRAVPDAARLVTGAERFIMRAGAGREAVLVVRSMGPITARVRIGEGPELPLVGRPENEGSWTESVLPIAASLIRGASIQVRVEARGGAYQEGGHASAHWWLYQ